jgi:hypothetical protein
MIRYTFRDQDHYMVGIGLFMEAGADWRAVGGNEVVVNGEPAFDDEQHAEMAKLLLREPQIEGPFPIQVDLQPVPEPEAFATPPVAGGEQLSGQPALSATEVEPPVDPAMPPRSGAGSGRDAWATYATSLGLAVADDLTRDQIIDLVEAHR